MATLIDHFPRRPLTLSPDPKRRKNRIVLATLIALLALPGIYWGYRSVSSAWLRSDLQARGVRAAETMDAEGDCRSRRSRFSGEVRPIDCWLNLTYRLRPEEGGEVRTAPVHLMGRAPIFTPPAFYDPQDPGRVMLEPEMQRSMTWSELIGPVFLLFLPALLFIGYITATSRRGLARAARVPDPVLAQVEKAIRQPSRLTIHTRIAGADRAYVDSFANPEAPFQVAPPAGAPSNQQWVLALRSPKGRHYVLDSQLAWLDFTDDERNRLFGAARGY